MKVHLITFKAPQISGYSHMSKEYETNDYYMQMENYLQQSIKKNAPGVEIVMHDIDFTEEELVFLAKCKELLWTPLCLTPLKWHKISTNYLKLKRQAEIASYMDCDIVFMDSDMLVVDNPFDVFNDNFDIGLTNRGKGNPVNGGMVFLKPANGAKIYAEWESVATEMIQSVDLMKKWLKFRGGICQGSLAEMIERGFEDRYNVAYYPCSVYNATYCDGWLDGSIIKKAKVLHFNHTDCRMFVMNGEISPRYSKEVRWFLQMEIFQYKMKLTKDLREKFKKLCGVYPNIDNPKTIQDKILYKKLNDRNPLIVSTSDKIKVRDYVADCGYKDLLLPIKWSGKQLKVKDVKSGMLKANNGSGWTYIINKGCKASEVIRASRRWQDTVYGVDKAEWGYFMIDPMLYIEEMPNNKPLKDVLNVFCFNGEPKYILFYRFEFKKLTGKSVICRQLYDLDWNYLDVDLIAHLPKPYVKIDKPEKLDYIIDASRKLSTPFDFARVDFMFSESSVYFSEITHYPMSGHLNINPADWSEKWGDMLDLDCLKKD